MYDRYRWTLETRRMLLEVCEIILKIKPQYFIENSMGLGIVYADLKMQGITEVEHMNSLREAIGYIISEITTKGLDEKELRSIDYVLYIMLNGGLNRVVDDDMEYDIIKFKGGMKIE